LNVECSLFSARLTLFQLSLAREMASPISLGSFRVAAGE
jgi:hypothetical protein